jgi:hypothetical protein
MMLYKIPDLLRYCTYVFMLQWQNERDDTSIAPVELDEFLSTPPQP